MLKVEYDNTGNVTSVERIPNENLGTPQKTLFLPPAPEKKESPSKSKLPTPVKSSITSKPRPIQIEGKIYNLYEYEDNWQWLRTQYPEQFQGEIFVYPEHLESPLVRSLVKAALCFPHSLSKVMEKNGWGSLDNEDELYFSAHPLTETSGVGSIASLQVAHDLLSDHPTLPLSLNRVYLDKTLNVTDTIREWASYLGANPLFIQKVSNKSFCEQMGITSLEQQRKICKDFKIEFVDSLAEVLFPEDLVVLKKQNNLLGNSQFYDSKLKNNYSISGGGHASPLGRRGIDLNLTSLGYFELAFSLAPLQPESPLSNKPRTDFLSNPYGTVNVSSSLFWLTLDKSRSRPFKIVSSSYTYGGK